VIREARTAGQTLDRRQRRLARRVEPDQHVVASGIGFRRYVPKDPDSHAFPFTSAARRRCNSFTDCHRLCRRARRRVSVRR
jgi:hypothetical protein